MLILCFDNRLLDYIEGLLTLRNKTASKILLDKNEFVDVKEPTTDIFQNRLDTDLVNELNFTEDISEVILGINFDILDANELLILQNNLCSLFINWIRSLNNNNKEVSVVILILFPNEMIVSNMKKIKYVLSQVEIMLENFKREQFQMEVDFRMNSLTPLFLVDSDDVLQSWMRRLQIRQSLNRYVTSEDLANVLNFLLSEESKVLRSQQIVLDYGYLD